VVSGREFESSACWLFRGRARAAAAIGVFAWHRQHKIEEQVIREADQAHTEEVKLEAQAEIPPLETRIGPGDNFPSALQKSGISAEDAAAILTLRSALSTCARSAPATPIVVMRNPDGGLRAIDYKIDADRMLQISAGNHNFTADVKTHSVKDGNRRYRGNNRRFTLQRRSAKR
jgi:hypothetical protein